MGTFAGISDQGVSSFSTGTIQTQIYPSDDQLTTMLNKQTDFAVDHTFTAPATLLLTLCSLRLKSNAMAFPYSLSSSNPTCLLRRHSCRARRTLPQKRRKRTWVSRQRVERIGSTLGCKCPSGVSLICPASFSLNVTEEFVV